MQLQLHIFKEWPTRQFPQDLLSEKENTQNANNMQTQVIG